MQIPRWSSGSSWRGIHVPSPEAAEPEELVDIVGIIGRAAGVEAVDDFCLPVEEKLTDAPLFATAPGPRAPNERNPKALLVRAIIPVSDRASVFGMSVFILMCFTARWDSDSSLDRFWVDTQISEIETCF